MSMVTTTSPAIFTLFKNAARQNQLPSTFITNPNFTPKPNPRLRIIRKAAVFSKQGYNVNSGISPENFGASSKESIVNVKLPRRSLLVQFTCNACGERTKRLINRVAYKQGTVFVQCSRCLQHHKLVDNLGLVVEYDFRNNIDED